MKLDENLLVKQIAGEHVAVMQGKYGVDMTRLVALNESSLYLFEQLQAVDFDCADVERLLVERYDVDAATAHADAAAWIAKLSDNKLVK